MKKVLLFLSLTHFLFLSGISQCLDPTNVYSFTYDGKTYELVRENKTWVDAAACAVEQGGILAEINDENEQNALYDEVSNNAGIVLTNTVAPDGGNASYVWIGGNDISVEGNWVWDGNNDGISTQFWQGTATGNPVGGLYSNWGNEPDNFGPLGQNGLGLALTQWPIFNGFLGSASQWNDVQETNTLYYIIEYDALSVPKHKLNESIQLYPNPSKNLINIKNTLAGLNIENYSLSNIYGQKIKLNGLINNEHINISSLHTGIYFLEINFSNNQKVIKKIVKE